MLPRNHNLVPMQDCLRVPPRLLYSARNPSVDTGTRLMAAKSLLAAALIPLALASAGCSRNRTIPTSLAPSRTTAIGVNTYLWRAAIDTLSFAPLITADSNGGVIVTDWYSQPASPGERVKLTVSIMDQDLRADALRVAASRQVNTSGQWVDAPVSAATVQKLEDIILTRARDIRRGSVSG